MGFIFMDPIECNLNLIYKFYANLQVDARTQIVLVQGVEVNMSWWP